MRIDSFERVKGRLLNYAKYNKQRILRTPRYLLTKRVRSFLAVNNDSSIDPKELDKIRKFLKSNLIEVFNDPFVYIYNFKDIKVYRDKVKDLCYVLTSEDKRLYFKRGLSNERIVSMYNSLCKEQDIHSPHNYFFEALHLSKQSVVADIGVAEGNFGLEIIDKIGKLYLFECESEWVEALEATFEPWKEKVHIVNTFVSDKTTSDSIRLDDYFRDRIHPDLFKLDVEGTENSVLEGATDLLQEQKATELLVCTYHKKEDAKKLSEKLINFGYAITFSGGYMLFLAGDTSARPPYDFRRGLLHAVKQKQ